MVSSRLSDKVEIREDALNGKGIFAKEDIKKNEIVFIKGGHILKRKEIFSSGGNIYGTNAMLEQYNQMGVFNRAVVFGYIYQLQCVENNKYNNVNNYKVIETK